MLTMSLIFVNFQRKKLNINFNVISNNSWYISGKNFVKNFFSTCKTHKNLKIKETVPYFKTLLLLNLTLCQNELSPESFHISFKNVLSSRDSRTKETKPIH